MGLRINNNIAALNSYNSLNKTDKAVSSSLAKLSSGYRINKAADDAAGLVVSEGLRSQIGGLTVAARNAQDGVNVAQTADGALGTATDILQRMRDLAVQAANSGSQDSTAQAAANKEFAALSSELGRISSTTSFGGQQLLSGTYNGTFQIGANNTSNDQLAIDLSSSSNLFSGSTPATAQVKASASYSLASVAVNDVLTVGGGASGVTVAVTVTSASAAGAAQALNANTTFSNTYTASVDTTTGNLVVTAKAGLSGQLLTVTDSVSGHVGTAASSTTGVTYVKAVNISGFNASGLGLSGIDLNTAADAQAAIDAVSNALAGVSNARAAIGAIQNRFEHSIDNLNTSIQNITASESAIRDTDMAAEMTKFTKNQVLSQAGTSMLAQANSSTQNILTLLRG